MAGIEGIVGTFGCFGETRKAPGGTNGGKLRRTARQKLMGITLMPHIPDNPVLRGLKNQVQGNGQFHHPQVGSQMPPIPADGGYDEMTNFPGKLVQFREG
jgi:hypothetical protein